MAFSKKKLFLFGISGVGANMLNLIIGTYLGDALLKTSMVNLVANRTYLNRDLVIISGWAIATMISQIINGVIDVPFASYLDNMKSKIGKRKAGIIMGAVPMCAAFLLFLVSPFNNKLSYHTVTFESLNALTGKMEITQNSLVNADAYGIANTIWFAVMLALFYVAYTCVMLAYYACFSEITSNDKERQYIANVKSVIDVVYFSIGYALIPVLYSFMNIRTISLIFFPLSLTLLIPIFLLRGEPKTVEAPQEKPPGMIKSLIHAFKNKGYLSWMVVYALMNFGIQMFLTGQGEYLADVGGLESWRLAIVNAAAFAPVPLTILIYNFFVKRRGLRFGYVYAMLAYVVGMIICTFVNDGIIADVTTRMIVGIIGAFACSLGIGTFFSISYVIPPHIAAVEREETGYTQPSMYFAVQGLVGAGTTAISTGLIWINMRSYGGKHLLMIVTAVFITLSCIATVILPKSIKLIGKQD